MDSIYNWSIKLGSCRKLHVFKIILLDHFDLIVRYVMYFSNAKQYLGLSEQHFISTLFCVQIFYELLYRLLKVTKYILSTCSTYSWYYVKVLENKQSSLVSCFINAWLIRFPIHTVCSLLYFHCILITYGTILSACQSLCHVYFFITYSKPTK